MDLKVLIDFLKKAWTIVHGFVKNLWTLVLGFDRFYEENMDYSSWF